MPYGIISKHLWKVDSVGLIGVQRKADHVLVCIASGGIQVVTEVFVDEKLTLLLA